MEKLGEHAVVLGASMGGLVAARVLADFYDKVTVVERDVLPHDAANRRGVPQGRHVHALLGRGTAVLNDLFPGFADELVGAGAPSVDYHDLSEMYFSFAGREFIRTGEFLSVPPVLIPSRPLLESVVRQRLRAIENVTLLEGYDVVELTSTGAGNRVTGALIRAHNGHGEQVLTADLVTDATGRRSRTPVFPGGGWVWQAGRRHRAGTPVLFEPAAPAPAGHAEGKDGYRRPGPWPTHGDGVVRIRERYVAVHRARDGRR
jgi:2-polyprenyl-6-methoxyphenol hydroxylase-like FAD-dependent oxidoreductase